MKDVLHDALKWIDYNRGTVLALAMLATVLVLMMGCQPTAIWNGESLTADEIEAKVEEEKEAVAEEVAARQAEIAEIVANATRLQAEASAMLSNAEAAGVQLDESARAKYDALQARAEKALSVIDAKYQQIETLLNLGMELGSQAAAGTPMAAAIPYAGSVLAALLLGRWDKSRADRKIAEQKAQLKV